MITTQEGHPLIELGEDHMTDLEIDHVIGQYHVTDQEIDRVIDPDQDKMTDDVIGLVTCQDLEPGIDLDTVQSRGLLEMTDGEEKHHLQKQKMTGTKRNTTKSSKKRNEGKRKKVCQLKVKMTPMIV
jgi:hypothetical protein